MSIGCVTESGSAGRPAVTVALSIVGAGAGVMLWYWPLLHALKLRTASTSGQMRARMLLIPGVSGRSGWAPDCALPAGVWYQRKRTGVNGPGRGFWSGPTPDVLSARAMVARAFDKRLRLAYSAVFALLRPVRGASGRHP